MRFTMFCCGDCKFFEVDNPNANHIFYDGWCTQKKEEQDSDNIASVCEFFEEDS